MKKFARVYDESIAQSLSKRESFIRAVEEFKGCNPFKKLSISEWDRIIDAFIAIENPRDTFLKIVAYTPSKKTIKLLQNPDFLKDLALAKKN